MTDIIDALSQIQFVAGFIAGGVVFGFLGLAIGWSKGWAAGWYEADRVKKPPTEKRIHNW